MRRRLLVLPIAAAAIVAACVYKVTRTYAPQAGAGVARVRALPARQFELLNSDTPSELVRLASFLGRHRVVLVFFDAAAGADHDPILERLRKDYDAVQADGTIVLGVSEALPQDNRKIFARSGEFPFPLLSDPTLEVHRAWGLVDETTRKPLPAVFIIDRKGEVAWTADAPQPLRDPQTTLDELLAGE